MGVVAVALRVERRRFFPLLGGVLTFEIEQGNFQKGEEEKWCIQVYCA